MESSNWEKEGAHRLGNIHHLQIRLVPQIIDFCPKDRHAPPHLHKTQPLPPLDPRNAAHMRVRCILFPVALRIEQDELFGLIVVCRVARGIDASGKVPGAGSVSGSTGDEAEEEAAVVDAGLAHFHG